MTPFRVRITNIRECDVFIDYKPSLIGQVGLFTIDNYKGEDEICGASGELRSTCCGAYAGDFSSPILASGDIFFHAVDFVRL